MFAETGELDEVRALSAKKILTADIRHMMDKNNISKTQLAREMHTENPLWIACKGGAKPPRLLDEPSQNHAIIAKSRHAGLDPASIFQHGIELMDSRFRGNDGN